MIDLFTELKNIVSDLEAKGVPYALCGGLAMAVHGHPRATVDIDLLIDAADVSRVMDAAREHGFVIEAKPMSFSKGAMEIRRISKIVDGDVLMLDLLLVTDALKEVWADRERYEFQDFALEVVSRSGLIRLKEFRRSPQDLADIENLSHEQQD